MKKIDWAEVYDKELVYAPGCWKTCGGYCCKNFYAEQFSVLDKSGVVLPLLASEYAYYQSIGGIGNINAPAKKRTFQLNNGKSFSIFLLSCSCEGLCNPHTARPLICRIYPYFPLVNAQGEIEGFEYAALMDLFYRQPETEHKCTLVREQADRVKQELKENLASLLQDPEMVFIFLCLKTLVARLKDKMQGFLDGKDEEKQRKFIRKYEWMVLSGKPWKDTEFAQQINDHYEAVKKAFGGSDFL